MKIYKIIDEEIDLFIGTLLYYEKANEFVIELADNLDEWTAPLLTTGFVKNGIYTIPRDISLLWVKERVIPPGRQNIGAILNTHRLKQYSEIAFLEKSSGRCSQDHLCIKQEKEIPDYVSQRRKKNIKECVVLSEANLLCFFEDNTTKKITLSQLIDIDGVEKVLKNPILFQSCKVGTGGYCITFNDSIDISAGILYQTGLSVPLELEDFVSFTKRNVVDTMESCNILECSRQNISYMLKQNQLRPIKKDTKGNLYLKGEILKNKW